MANGLASLLAYVVGQLPCLRLVDEHQGRMDADGGAHAGAEALRHALDELVAAIGVGATLNTSNAQALLSDPHMSAQLRAFHTSYGADGAEEAAIRGLIDAAHEDDWWAKIGWMTIYMAICLLNEPASPTQVSFL